MSTLFQARAITPDGEALMQYASKDAAISAFQQMYVGLGNAPVESLRNAMPAVFILNSGRSALIGLVVLEKVQPQEMKKVKK